MEELKEKANNYAEEKVLDVLKEALAKVYADGYRDGYKDREAEMPVNLRHNETEFVDLGLPSGTLWAKEYEKDSNEIMYLPYQETKQFQLPTEEMWKELLETCKWKGDYSSSGLSFYGVVCIGPNGNSIKFSSKGYIQLTEILGRPNYGGGYVYFWLDDGEEGNEKKAIYITSGSERKPDIEILKVFTGYKLPVRLVKMI